ncbi:sigma-70 family RNA polymerase sigma factor [candidate division KSB1 bacterium]|nr:sigma-70 family RNA polymerase sigma factor [candidate division KSB1 bacterium]RQW01673.1 MAG: sigma-70 family RNA polymerase sigma factor [candidate division KSB1 bacterium]
MRRFDEHIKLCALRECRRSISNREKKQLPEIVQDRASEVYAKLVSDNNKALKNFVGLGENSIFVYLAVITRNVVKNWFIREKGTQKRPLIDISLDDSCENSSLERGFGKTSNSPEVMDVLQYEERKNEIEKILNSYLRGKNRGRNKLIFKMYFYEDFSANEIVKSLPYPLTLKTVENILSHLKKVVQNGLTGGKREPG